MKGGSMGRLFFICDHAIILVDSNVNFFVLLAFDVLIAYL